MAILLLSWDWAVYLVTHPLWGGLTGFIIGFVLRMLLYHRKRRPSDHLTPEKRKLQKEYRRLLRRLRRRKLIGAMKFRRPPNCLPSWNSIRRCRRHAGSN